MNAMVADVRCKPFQHNAIPVRPASLPTTYKLNARIGPLHDLGKLNGFSHILFSTEHSNLPATIHFIAQAPVLHTIWFLMPMLATQICPVRVAGPVTVFNPCLCLIQCSCTHIDADIWFSPYSTTIFY